ncbi:MAG TPA: glucosaminidase domain-containing protein [Flavobacteriales bacterium]|nr:glucosaminidase domain-containing protein [Flavobacteriales bacterium]
MACAVDMWITRFVLCLLVGLPLAQAQGQPPNKRFTAEEYIEQWKGVAVKKMGEHGIPASVTLAQGLLESGNGNSELARTANNHFGIKCTPDWTGGKSYHDDDQKNDCFRKYRDASDSFEDHSKFLKRPRYASLFELKPTDYKGWARGLKAAGYATDPSYPQKLINLIERYELHKLDHGVDVAYKPTGKELPKNERTSKPAPERNRRRPSSGGETITITQGRSVEVFEGRIKFVRVKQGDTFRKLAQDLDMTHGMLARWNDMDKEATLSEGQIIFIQPKRSKAKDAETHMALEGESLWGVSQQYGVKLDRLAKYNGLAMDAKLSAGQRVWLKKPKR